MIWRVFWKYLNYNLKFYSEVCQKFFKKVQAIKVRQMKQINFTNFLFYIFCSFFFYKILVKLKITCGYSQSSTFHKSSSDVCTISSNSSPSANWSVSILANSDAIGSKAEKNADARSLWSRRFPKCEVDIYFLKTRQIVFWLGISDWLT